MFGLVADNELDTPDPLLLTMSQDSEIQYYHHGRFRVAGGVLPDAITAYQTFGDPKNPVIVFPTCYGGKLGSESLKYSPLPSMIAVMR